MTNQKSGGHIIKWVLLYFIPILLRGCFWYTGIPYSLEKALALVTAVILLFIFFSQIYRKKTPKGSLGRLIHVVILLSFISIINAFLYWGQSPSLTFSAGYGIYVFAYYFILQKYRIGSGQIYILLMVFTAIYGLLWLYAFSMAPTTVFGNKDEISDNRGMFRIALEGLDLVGLFYFFSLSRFLSNKKNVMYLLFSIIAFLLIFVTLSRMLIVAVSIVTLYYVIRKQSMKTIILVTLLFSLGWGTIMQNEIIKNLIELQEKQSEKVDGDKIIRNEYTDCVKLFPFNIGTVLFGNGCEHIASSYGKREDRLKNDYKFNRSDAGYPGYYVTYGLVSLLIIFYIFYRVLKTKIPDEIYYCKLFIIYFMIISITTFYFVNGGLALMISLYIIDTAKFNYFHKFEIKKV